MVLQQLRRLPCSTVASAQHPRQPKTSKTRVPKLPNAGSIVNFVDVVEATRASDSVAPAAPGIREERLSRRQRQAVKALCWQLQVPPSVAIAIAIQEPHLADFGTSIMTSTIAAFAKYFDMSCSTLGMVLALRPGFITESQLLETHISEMSKLLSLSPEDFTSLLSRAPELVAYSPEYFAVELKSVANLLQMEAYEVAALVRLEPRLLVDGSRRLSDRLQQLSQAMNKTYPAVAVVVRTWPSVLYLNMARLQKKREFMDEVCSSHPCWQQQLAEMPATVMMELLKSYGVPVFMRLRYLAKHGHQANCDLARVFASSTKQFDKKYPTFFKWAEWNTPSYMFE